MPQARHCLNRNIIKSSGTAICAVHYNLEILAYDPLKYILLFWVKVQNFQNPELSKLQF